MMVLSLHQEGGHCVSMTESALASNTSFVGDA
jgi:hypothetical protein